MKIYACVLMFTVVSLIEGGRKGITHLLNKDSMPLIKENLEFRVKAITNETMWEYLDVYEHRECYNPSEFLPTSSNEVVRFQWDVARPDYDSGRDMGIILTPYKVKTYCERSFLGGTTKKIKAEDLTQFKDIPAEFVTEIVNKNKNLIGLAYKGSNGWIDFDVPSIYDCPWLSSATKDVILIKSQPSELQWSPTGHLVFPSISKKCNYGSPDGLCSISGHSLIMFTPHEHKLECSFFKTATLDGSMKLDPYDRNSLTLFASKQEQILNLPVGEQGEMFPLCLTKEEVALESEEGVIISISIKKLGAEIYKYLADRSRTNLTQSDWVDLTFGGKLNKTRNGHKRAHREVLDDECTLCQKFFPNQSMYKDPPPPLTSSIMSNDEQISNISRLFVQEGDRRRKRRDSVINFPERKRLAILEERIALGFSETEFAINKLAEKDVSLNLWVKYQNCMLRETIRRLALSATDHSIYAASVLVDPTVVAKPSRLLGKLDVLQGTKVASLTLPSLNTMAWCDGDLWVGFKYPDHNDMNYGWLYPGLGRVTVNQTKRSCKTNRQPSHFLIPTYGHGSYDVISQKLIDRPQEDQEIKLFKFRFPQLSLQDDSTELDLLIPKQNYAALYTADPTDNDTFLDMWEGTKNYFRSIKKIIWTIAGLFLSLIILTVTWTVIRVILNNSRRSSVRNQMWR